jgi:hypothetical protein
LARDRAAGVVGRPDDEEEPACGGLPGQTGDELPLANAARGDSAVGCFGFRPRLLRPYDPAEYPNFFSFATA